MNKKIEEFRGELEATYRSKGFPATVIIQEHPDKELYKNKFKEFYVVIVSIGNQKQAYEIWKNSYDKDYSWGSFFTGAFQKQERLIN